MRHAGDGASQQVCSAHGTCPLSIQLCMTAKRSSVAPCAVEACPRGEAIAPCFHMSMRMCHMVCSAGESPHGCWGVTSPQSVSGSSAMASQRRSSLAATPESASVGDKFQVRSGHLSGGQPACSCQKQRSHVLCSIACALRQSDLMLKLHRMQHLHFGSAKPGI